MNRNDLMNSLSGIDPKYIDEAAFELHESPADKRRSKVVSLKKSLFVILPAAAAILLTVTALFTLRSTKSNRTAEAPAAEAAAEAPAAEATEPAFEAEEAMSEAADEAPAYEAEEATATAESGAFGEDAEAASHSYDMKENAGEVQSLTPATNTDTLGKTDRSAMFIGLTGVSFDEGILTLETTEALPADPGGIAYSISAVAADGSEKIVADGTLEDVIKEKDPLTLDISKLKLQAGSYKLSIGRESSEFEVK